MLRSGTLSLLAAGWLTGAALAQTTPVWRPIVLEPPPAANSHAVDRSPYAQVVSFETPGDYPAHLSENALAQAPAFQPVVNRPATVMSRPMSPADLPPTLAPVPADHWQTIPVQGTSFVPVDGNCGCSPAIGLTNRMHVAPYSPALINSYRPVAPPQPTPQYTIGKGILGQPTLYVPGQPVRNALRWLSP